MEYKKRHTGIPKIVVKMYNNSRKQAKELCNVHYAQLTRHYFVEYVESLLAMVPMVLLYLRFQKQFIEGIAMTGGK